MLLYSTLYLARPLFVSEQLDSLHAVLTSQSPDWSKNLRSQIDGLSIARSGCSLIHITSNQQPLPLPQQLRHFAGQGLERVAAQVAHQ